MSSSSSECDGYDYYGPQGLRLVPDINHPYVYYAQVPNQCKTQNANYFQRACHWYSQERAPCRKEPDNINDMKGFAGWLDEKYNEYLVREQVDYEGPKNSLNNTREKKKNKRSPWRRRKKAAKNEDRPHGSTPSIRVILRPKNLIQTTSECCQSSKTETCCPQCAHGKCPISLTAAPRSRCEIGCRSKSVLSVHQETEIQVIPFDCREDTPNRQLFWMPLQTVPKQEIQIQYWNTVLPTNADKKQNQASLKPGHRSYKDISSQISEPDGRGSQTNMEKKRKSVHMCKCPEDESPKIVLPDVKKISTMNPTCPCTSDASKLPVSTRPTDTFPNQNTTEVPNAGGPNQESSDRPGVGGPTQQQFAERPTPVLLDFSGQTSDHSIKFECPTYMRIVNADKLNE